MKKRWINCAALLKHHDVPPVESVRAVTGGKIEAYSIQLRKIVDVKHFEIKKGLCKDIETESDRIAQETGKAYLALISPDARNIGVMLDKARAGKILDFRLNNNIPVFYVIHPYETLPISFDWLESVIQNPSRKFQCEELSFLQFKYEDAVRCFGLAQTNNTPFPVVEVQAHPAGQEVATPSTDAPDRTAIDWTGNVPVVEAQDAPDATRKNAKMLKPSNKDMDKQDALAVATGYWEGNPELRSVEIARAIIQKGEVNWRCKPPEQKTLRDWLAQHAPKSAKKIGRPPGIPKQ